ncbi:RHS repeat-associated core domain-containing protein [uncultured Chryseobacterium sp.]|uniref:RHS repeat-associated core domain-containing protein n=1 Tax=uncultured Chryseobacterium sp. TaxID=259322 RepID=UPI0025E11AA1|nr:RHS repeat-associated core domain-containing protein [uncultured Chryseobacterium sp.]
MKKSFFKTFKKAELLPVFLPMILALSSWTLYHVSHKDKDTISEVQSLQVNKSAFSINCDFLKPSKNSDNKSDDKTSLNADKDSAEAQLPFYNPANLSYLDHKKTQPFKVPASLIESGYIGEIGNRDSREGDADASDNIFEVFLQTVNSHKSYTLKYDVDGYSDINSVTRSINGSFAMGGYVKSRNSGWNEVTETIDGSLLKQGTNRILFNVLTKSDYYQIKNVRISEGEHIEKPYHIVSEIYNDKVIYIRGFVNPESGISSVEVNHKKLNIHGNEFEYVSSARHVEEIISVKFNTESALAAEKTIVKNNSNTDRITGIEFQPETKVGMVYENQSGSLKGVRNIDLPPLDLSTVNVSGQYDGFQFINQSSEEVGIYLPYDIEKLPKGYHENDISVFSFDYNQKKWVSAVIDSINTVKKYVLLHSSLKNAQYIAGVVKQPESPETGASAPTVFNDVPIANPSAKMNIMSPPVANQQGSANLQYPIEIPAGISGFQPNASLVYNSDNKFGWAGTGWDFPVETIDIDTRWGIPAFSQNNESEIYMITGEQLVFKDDYLPNKVPYTEARSSDRLFYYRNGIKEGYSITRKGASPTGYTWEVKDGSGTKREYLDVLTDNPSSNNSGNVVKWYLSKVTDRFGNTITYTYLDSYEGGGKNKYLSKITYSNNTVVEFENETGIRQDMTFNYKLGVKLTDAKILSKITVKRAGKKIREYALSNTAVGQFSKRLLKEIIQKDGNGNIFNKHILNYNTGVSIFDKNPTKVYSAPKDNSNVGSFLGGNTSMINGTYSKNKNLRGSISVGFGFCIGGSINKKNTVGITGSYDDNRAYGKNQLLDIDGDGLLDKAFYTDGTIRFRKNTKTGFSGIYSSIGLPAETAIHKHNAYSTTIGLEYSFKKGVVGANYSWGNTNSPTYFSDVNGDGLLDMVTYGEVFFSKIRNGAPQFKSQPAGGTVNVTEETPNAILEGTAAVMDTVSTIQYATSLARTVRMWEAPVTGSIEIKNILSLDQQSQDGVEVWIEQGSMTKANEYNANYTPPVSTVISPTVTLTSTGQQQSLDAITNIEKGQRIFIVVSSKNNPDGDKINVNTNIVYTSVSGISNLNLKDANSNNYYAFNASSHYLASGLKDNVVGDPGKVKISWNTLSNDTFTDDVNFKIYKIVQPIADTTGVVAPSSSTLIYHHKLPKGSSLTSVLESDNLVSNSDISNILVNQNPSDSTMTMFHFDVSADTNVSWEKIKWKPEMTIMSDTDTIAVKAIVQYNPYSERLTNNLPQKFNKYSPINVSSCRYLLYPKYGSSIDDVLNLNLSQSHNTSVIFSLKLRDESGNIYTFKNTVNVVNNAMPMPRINYCQVADQLQNQYGIDNAQLYNMDHYFEISSLDYDVAKYLANINPDIYNSNFEPNGLTMSMPNGSTVYVPANTGHKADHFAYRANNTHYNIQTGLVYQGWGGFTYNGSKYPGETIKEGEFATNTLSNVPQPGGSIPCDPSAPDYATCMTNYIIQQNNNRYFTPLELDAEKYAYVSPLESVELTGEYLQPYMLGALTGSQSIITQNPVFSVPNPRGIILRSKTDALHLYAAGSITPWLGINAHGGFSTDKTSDYFQDFNGDHYPDIISGGLYQKTNILGQLGNTLSVNKKQIKSKGTILGVGVSASPSIAKYGNNSGIFFYIGGEKDMHTGSSSFSLGVTANVNIGKAWAKGNGVWSDINGDGLVDYITDGKTFINNGSDFVYDPYSWNVSDVSNSDSFAISGGGGFSMANGSWAGGVGLSKSTSTAKNGLIDVNGDGIADKIVKNGSTYEMWINNGTAFISPDNFSKDFSLDNRQNSSGFNFFGTLCGCLGLKLCFSGGWNTDKSVSKQEVDLRDFDGDGYPDLLISNDDTSLTYYHNNLPNANLLISVENPLQGLMQLDYNYLNSTNLESMVGATYQMPFTKTVLTEVNIWNFRPYDTTLSTTNGVNDPQKIKPRERYGFEYEKGIQDRREREFLGFGIVRTKVYNDRTLHQTYTVEYETNYTGNENNFYVNYNDTKVRQYFYKKGLIRSKYMLDNQNRKRSETKYTYSYFDQPSSNGYQLSENQAEPQYKDVGRIIPLLYKTESSATEFSGSSSHTKTIFNTIDSYDKYGNVIQATDRGISLANGADDVKVSTSYHAPGAKNIINQPSEQTVTANGQVLRKNTTSLDANQNIANIKKYLGTQTADFDMEYDAYGNLIKVTQPASENGQRMAYTYTYDPVYHTYLISTKDSYNYISSTTYDTDYLFGVPVAVTDINGVSAYYTYDSFGRLVQYRSPVDTEWTVKMYYYPSENIPVAITERKAPEVNGNIPEVNYFSSLFTDAWGEGLMMKKLFKKENGNYYFANNVYQIKDKLGRPVRTVLRDKVTQGTNIINSLKTFDDYLTSEDQAIQTYSAIQYDEMDRPVVTTQANVMTNNSLQHLITKMFYEFGTDRAGNTQFSTRVVSPLGETSVTYTDEKGRTTSSKQSSGSQDLWVSYQYDLISQLTQMNDAGDHPTKYTYDMLGRKTAVSQPDSGTEMFEYDLSGKMIRSQNALLKAGNNKVIYRYNYDQLSQVVYPDHSVSYEYGAAGAADYAAGRLTKQTDRTGTQSFKYTMLGHLKEDMRIVVAPNNVPKMFKTSFVYDVFNRINKIVYPDTEEVYYNYNMAGLLDNIQSKLPGELKSNAIAYAFTYDNRDQMTSYMAGNGTKTLYNYDPWGRMEQLSLFYASNGNGIRKNHYTFNGNGNISHIQGITPNNGSYPDLDMAVSTDRTFQYDIFGRLQSAVITATGKNNTKYYDLDMNYNAAGNIDSKNYGLKSYVTGACQYPGNDGNKAGYIYQDPKHPNAVSEISYTHFENFNSPLDCGGVPSTNVLHGHERFSYDVNGNLTSITEKYTDGGSFGYFRNLFWDEQNRLKAVVTQNQYFNHYVYDAYGERILKNDAVSKKMYVNGNDPANTTQMGAYIYYPNGYLVLSEKSMSKHYYMGGQRIATRVSQVPSHRFKINVNGIYDELAQSIGEEITTILHQAGLPPAVWVDNADSQGTYIPPTSATQDQNTCSYIVEQQLMIFEQDGNAECFDKLKDMYSTALNTGSNICDMWSEFLQSDCMANYTPPELLKAEMYWIHPDHLSGSSVLMNSGGKITNWYEYMPYGEMLMELSNQDYNNPYKYNGKEFDINTGYYYYGARYYDPKRSFWLSVDPLAEITQSPYAYVWNDPVNYADPSGMLGERVGGEGPGDPKKRSWVRKAWDWFIGRKHHGKVIVGQATSQREPDNSNGELPWYLNKSKYGGKPVLTLGAHNIELPYIERDEYGSNIFENGDTFLKNTVGSMYNGLASTWNEGMAGKEGCSFMYEGDSDIESTVRHIARGNVNAEEIEGIAAVAIFHKVGGLHGEGKIIGLGLDEDLYRHRGTGAITWKEAQWQKEGLTTVRWEKVVMDKFNFKNSFQEAADNASAIRFDVTNFNPAYHKKGVTHFEFNHILNRPDLFKKTTFIKNGNVVIWNGTQFINK